MNIKEFSKHTKVSPQTLRYYENVGLLKIKRSANSYRIYETDDIERVQLIRLLRFFDVSIEDIKEYLENEITIENIKSILIHELVFSKNKLEIQEYIIKLFDKQQLSEVLSGWDTLIEHETSYEEDKYVTTFFDVLDVIPPLLGPIMLTIFFVYFKNSDFNSLLIKISFPFTIYAVLHFVSIWKKYIEDNRNSKSYKIFLLIVVSFVNMAILLLIQELFAVYFFTNETTIVLAQNSQIIMFLTIASVMQFTLILFYKNTKLIYISLFFMMLMLYASASNVTSLNEDGSVIRYSPINVSGTKYFAEDVRRYKVIDQKNKFSNLSFIIETDDFIINIIDGILMKEHDFTNLLAVDKLYQNLNIPKDFHYNGKCYYTKNECDTLELIFKP